MEHWEWRKGALAHAEWWPLLQIIPAMTLKQRGRLGLILCGQSMSPQVTQCGRTGRSVSSTGANCSKSSFCTRSRYSAWALSVGTAEWGWCSDSLAAGLWVCTLLGPSSSSGCIHTDEVTNGGCKGSLARGLPSCLRSEPKMTSFAQHSGISCARWLKASMAVGTLNHFWLNISYYMVPTLSSSVIHQKGRPVGE